MRNVIGRIEVPVEQVKRIRGSRQAVYNRKLYPGYVFMEMELDKDGKIPEKAWFAIKETSGVGDFIGTEGLPTPMQDTETAKLLMDTTET